MNTYDGMVHFAQFAAATVSSPAHREGPRGEGSQSLAAMVAAAAAAATDAVALRCGATALTYGELLAAADALAGRLTELGVAPNVPVGICLPRSFEQVIAALGILRAGGAFLPLDPAWPRDRHRQVLDDALAPVVITRPDGVDRLAGDGRIAVAIEPPQSGMQMSGLRMAGLPQAGAPLHAGVDAAAGPDDLAYLIYTSGSTGVPKGVEITHRNLLNLIAWHQEAFAVTAQDRASTLAGLGFDAAVWEVWPYLAAGASVSLVDEAVRASADRLRQWLVDEKISIAFVPTPVAEPLIAAAWPAETSLRILLTGGDTLHAWPRPGLPFTVVNNYGPSECTVVATSGVVPTSEALPAGTPAIGRPIANTQIHILDDALNPVAAGEIGEIFVGGANVGRGYRNQPRLTAERFVADPFRADAAGARLYRTGDLGRRLPDGQIAFHGRRDDQLKLRGHRVEPDEVSAALNRHPKVAQSAVAAREDGRHKRLVAYVVPAATGDLPRSRELRDFLALTLPDYMLPATFVRVPALPLTANGKIDRVALPAPGPGNTLPGAAYRAPETDVEKSLAAIVQELLSIARVGADDNFFLLGGHSLLGTQLVIKARDAFGVDLSLRDLFETQTVANLAALIERRIIETVDSMSEEDAQMLLAK